MHAHGALLLKRAVLYHDPVAHCVALALQAEALHRQALPGTEQLMREIESRLPAIPKAKRASIYTAMRHVGVSFKEME